MTGNSDSARTQREMRHAVAARSRNPLGEDGLFRMIPTDALAELLAAAEECAGEFENTIAMVDANMGADVDSDLAPVRRLRAAVARVRGE